MTRGNIHGRLVRLEESMPASLPPGSSDAKSFARQRMREHLDHLSALRRGELSPEKAAEVEATNAAIVRRLASRRGEGVTVDSSM